MCKLINVICSCLLVHCHIRNKHPYPCNFRKLTIADSCSCTHFHSIQSFSSRRSAFFRFFFYHVSSPLVRLVQFLLILPSFCLVYRPLVLSLGCKRVTCPKFSNTANNLVYQSNGLPQSRRAR